MTKIITGLHVVAFLLNNIIWLVFFVLLIWEHDNDQN
jgi:hypothetical protein